MAEPERKPCPECGKEVTWTNAGKPRAHKCEPKNNGGSSTSEGIFDKIIGKYIENRDLIAAIEARMKSEVAELKEQQEKIENFLAGKMQTMGLSSIKSGKGTCFEKYRESATVSDRESFFEWVHANWEENRYFLENRVSKSAVKQMIEDGDVPPPGISFTRVRGVNIRRA